MQAKKWPIILPTMLVLIVLLGQSLSAYGQTKLPGTNRAESESNDKGSATARSETEPAEEKQTEPQTKIDETGKQVGQKIDRLTRLATAYLGDWISVTVFAGITWLKLMISLLLIFLVLLVERIARLLINRQLRTDDRKKQRRSILRIVLEAAATPLSLFIWTYGFYIVLIPLFVHFRHPDGTNLVYSIAHKTANLAAAFALVWFIYKMVSIIDYKLKNWAESTESTIDDVLAPLVGRTLRVFIVVIGGILIIQNLTGVKIGPLLASVGIGGLAVALAARDTIANFFGTLTILFDKPFQVGERVLIDNYDGVVEDVGFRSTRIRTLTGHLVTIPNEKIVNSGLENIGKRPHIRWLTNLTITYDTPPDKVERAVSILEEILGDHEGMNPEFPPRVYFNGFNDWSLNIMLIAWYHPADYWAMQAWQQQTCLQILKRFNVAGIEFAFPSRTLYMANDDNRQLKLELLRGETATYVPRENSHE